MLKIEFSSDNTFLLDVLKRFESLRYAWNIKYDKLKFSLLRNLKSAGFYSVNSGLISYVR